MALKNYQKIFKKSVESSQMRRNARKSEVIKLDIKKTKKTTTLHIRKKKQSP